MKRQKDKNFRTGRIKNLPIIAALTFLMFVMTFGMAFAEDSGIDYTDRPNLKNAVDLYLGTEDGSKLDIVFLSSGASYGEIDNTLRDLRGEYSEKRKEYSGPETPTIVYAPSGTYHVTDTSNLGRGDVAGIKIPNNVIFVAEDNSIFLDEKGSDGHPLVMVGGSLYGGRYQKAKFAIKFENNKNFNENNTNAPSGKKLPNGTVVRKINGNVEYTQVEGPGKSGIQAIGARGINILHNYVGGGKAKNTTGIDLMYEASARNISYNTVKDIGSADYGSAISVTHSDVINIVGNNISNIAGHGISTDSEQKGHKHAYCRINYITRNTINGAKHGIWLEDGCQVTKGINDNTIKNTRNNGIAVSGTKRYTGGCNWSIYSMKNNKILSSKRSNISILGKYAKVCMRGNNLIDTSKQTNVITIDKAGRLDIKGDKNTIKRGKGNGIYLMNRSTLNITGKRNTVTANKGFGINVTGRSRAVVKNTNAKRNTKYSFRVCKGSSLRIYKCQKDKILKTTKTV